MIRRIFTSLLPAAIAGAGIVVAQLHGAPFWVALLGSTALGWVVSLTWEGASVWLWWRGGRRWGAHWWAKLAATAALVTGMVGNTAEPILPRFQAAWAATQTMAILGQQSAAGHWISQTTLKKAAATVGTAIPAWAEAGKLLAAAALFPALYALALLALTTLACEWGGQRPHPVRNSLSARPADKARPPSAEHPPVPNGGTPDPPNTPGRAAVIAYGKRHGLFAPGGSQVSQGAVARAIGESTSTLSEFVNGKTGAEKTAEIMGKLEG